MLASSPEGNDRIPLTEADECANGDVDEFQSYQGAEPLPLPKEPEGEFGKEQITAWQAAWNVTNAIQVTFLGVSVWVITTMGREAYAV